MKSHYLLLILLYLTPWAFAIDQRQAKGPEVNLETVCQPKNKVGIFRFEAIRNAHKAEVIFKTRTFDPAIHKITYADQAYVAKHNIHTVDPNAKCVVEIDGASPLGLEPLFCISSNDDLKSMVEIETLTLLFDGKRIQLPENLFRDCYNPNLSRDYMELSLGDDAKSVFLFMAGSDASGGYQVLWVL
jgi:hypothetical protein